MQRIERMVNLLFEYTLNFTEVNYTFILSSIDKYQKFRFLSVNTQLKAQ